MGRNLALKRQSGAKALITECYFQPFPWKTEDRGVYASATSAKLFFCHTVERVCWISDQRLVCSSMKVAGTDAVDLPFGDSRHHWRMMVVTPSRHRFVNDHFNAFRLEGFNFIISLVLVFLAVKKARGSCLNHSSIMPGGQTIKKPMNHLRLAPILTKIAVVEDGEPCVTYACGWHRQLQATMWRWFGTNDNSPMVICSWLLKPIFRLKVAWITTITNEELAQTLPSGGIMVADTRVETSSYLR